ncbi:MAG: diguanylate cyclase domain-containing protein [Lysobacter sp.]
MTTTLPSPADILDLLPDAVCVADAEGRVLFVSASFERILGYGRDEVLGRYVLDLVHPDDRAATREQAELVMGGALQRHFRNRYVHKDGHNVDIQWSAQWHAERGVRIAVAREVTELRRAERELEHLASHDPLTGLPNRHRLQRELQHALAHATRTDGNLAVLYLDLDGFKAANDRGGHKAGDQVLCEVADRLEQGIRQGDLIARIGGDEFIVLLPGCHDVEVARKIANMLRTRLRSPYSLPDGVLQLDVSIGIACFPADGNDLESLLAHADRAMYADKRLRTADAGVAPV